MKILLLLILSVHSAFAFDHSHADLKKVLDEVVVVKGRESAVDYKKLKQNPESLSAYLKKLSEIKKKEFESWDEDKRLATLINAYNAWTLKLIIDHYPVDSIKDIGSFFISPWQKDIVPWLGKTIDLDEIEHEIIRKNYQEPRIHFALVCASKGCPPLKKEPYKGETLDAQLEESKKNFLLNSAKNTHKLKGDELTLKVSSIFKWFPEDFGGKDKLKEYLVEGMGIQERAKGKKIELEYLDYDWDLNDL